MTSIFMGHMVRLDNAPREWQDCHMSHESRQAHAVAILALPAVVAFDLAIPAQVLGRRGEGRYDVTVCATRAGRVPSTTGYEIVAPAGLEAIARADTVVVPGYESEDDPAPAALRALRDAHERGARIVSICTGAFALAAAGLLDGRTATTHWQWAERLAQRHPRVDVDPDVLFVDDGDVMTSAGVAAGIDLCLHLVRCDHGAEFANAVARRMVVAAQRDGGQAQFVERAVPEDGAGLARTRAWMLERLGEPVSVAAMAGHAGYSERSFMRRFRAETGESPLRWLTQARVLEAQRLLEGTDLPVETVAARCGFGTAATLRTHFARQTATTPTGYRRTWLTTSSRL
jgi:transcriptional regulator GlxA family with amidase domain